ncbi:MAG: hypothetical protein AAGH99_03400 [Planctomycetota bacterium]
MASNQNGARLCNPQAARGGSTVFASGGRGRFRGRGGAVMVEALLVLPLIFVVLALVIYFGFSFERMQRGMMMDRYESWRGAAKAPGPAVDAVEGASVRPMQELFFVGDDPTLRLEPSDFFPAEPTESLERAAAVESVGALDLTQQYFNDFPRGRSMRFFVGSPASSPLLQRLFPGDISHRHTVMDTDWRFVNFVLEDGQWFDVEDGVYLDIRQAPREVTEGLDLVPTQTPSRPVRDVFYTDYELRLEPLSNGNPIAERLKDFYLAYPQYWGPQIDEQFEAGQPW